MQSRGAYRGGYFHNGAPAGVFALHLSNAPSYSDYNIGFRACEVKGCFARRLRRKCRDRSASYFGTATLTGGKGLTGGK